MKKQTPIPAMILLLAAVSVAGAQNTSSDPAVNSYNDPVVHTSNDPDLHHGHDVDNYRAQEFSLDVFGSLSLGKEEIRNISGNVIEDDSELGIGVGLNYFFTRNIGLGADAYSENSDGAFIDSASVNLILRLPLGEGGFAPYGYIGGGRQFDMAEEWFAQVGVGIEYRFTPQIGAFLDARAVFPEEVDYYGVARLGVRFGF